MMLKLVAFVSAILYSSAVLAQTSSTTSSAAAATHTVSVGADGLNYSPNQITDVLVGDIIEFRFYPLNHSVARAAFGDQPCIPYEDTGAGRVGFWSGFQPISIVTDDPPIFRLPINDTDPIFFYCSAPGACFEGMIGVINPNATFTFAAQLANALNATIEFSPLEYFPVEASPTRTTTATGATSTPTASTSSSATAGAAAVASKPGLGTGPIVGIAIGAFAVVILAAALIYMCGRQKTVTEILNRQSMAHSNHNSYMPSNAGLSEAQYPNMVKSPALTSDGRFSPYGIPATETESYRSTSPPIDERTGMMSMQQQMQLNLQQQGMVSPGSPGYPSPGYFERHEMENAQATTGMSSYHAIPTSQASPIDEGPHEMPVPSRNPSAAPAYNSGERPFSYTDSEAEFHATPRRPDEKSETDTY